MRWILFARIKARFALVRLSSQRIPVHCIWPRTEDSAFFLTYYTMKQIDRLRQGFIDFQTAADLMDLAINQREKFADLITADLKKSKLRADGSMPIEIAMKLCSIAKLTKC